MRKTVILSCLFLMGCSSNKDLDCPLSYGMPCHSVNQVSSILDKEDLLAAGFSSHHPEIYVVDDPLYEDDISPKGIY